MLASQGAVIESDEDWQPLERFRLKRLIINPVCVESSEEEEEEELKPPLKRFACQSFVEPIIKVHLCMNVKKK